MNRENALSKQYFFSKIGIICLLKVIWVLILNFYDAEVETIDIESKGTAVKKNQWLSQLESKPL